MRWVIKEGGYWACWPLRPCWAEGPERDGPWGQFTLRQLIRWAWLREEASPILHTPSVLHLTLTFPDWINYGSVFQGNHVFHFWQETPTKKLQQRKCWWDLIPAETGGLALSVTWMAECALGAKREQYHEIRGQMRQGGTWCGGDVGLLAGADVYENEESICNHCQEETLYPRWDLCKLG